MADRFFLPPGAAGGASRQSQGRYSSGSWEPPGAESHQPRPKATNPQPEGTTKPGGSQTSEATPEPTAKASEAQEPEPEPEKHREAEEEGSSPQGHGPPGKESQSAPGPKAATAATQAAERRAREERPAPKEEAESTEAPGRAARKAASAPLAQPTKQEQPGGRAAARAATKAGGGATEREPEKPQAGAEESKAAIEGFIFLICLIFYYFKLKKPIKQAKRRKKSRTPTSRGGGQAGSQGAQQGTPPRGGGQAGKAGGQAGGHRQQPCQFLGASARIFPARGLLPAAGQLCCWQTRTPLPADNAPKGGANQTELARGAIAY